MVLYLDMAFLLNCGVDALALFMTALLAGIPIRWQKMLRAAVVGGLYGIVCLLPAFSSAGGALGKCVVAMGMVYLSFGGGIHYFRRLGLFFVLSCAIGGATLAAAEVISYRDPMKSLIHMEWKVFLLVSVFCYTFLSFAFRGCARHIVSGQLTRGWIELGDRRVELTMLLDTGHTLTDPVWGLPVLIAEARVLEELWTESERAVLCNLESGGTLDSIERLNEVSPGRFRLLPYRAVGVSSGLLLSLRVDAVCVDGEVLRKAIVAISPTPLSENGEYSALWGGMDEKREAYRAA